LSAEGVVKVSEVPLVLQGNTLQAEMTEMQFNNALIASNLKAAFLRHEIVSIEPQRGDSLVHLVVEPNYAPARELSVEVFTPQGTPATGCAIALEVPIQRQLGRGWDRLPGGDVKSIPFVQQAQRYVADMTMQDAFVWLKDDLPALQLTNANPGCLLAPRSTVTLDELRGRRIVRNTEAAGPVLIAAATADPNLTTALSVPPQTIWTRILGIYDRAASEGWATRVLLRAQSPAVQTNITLLGAQGDLPAVREENRAGTLKFLTDASSPAYIPAITPASRLTLQSVPLLVRNGRIVARMNQVRTFGQEALLILSGGIQQQGSDTCAFIRGWPAGVLNLDWLQPLRRAVFIELWSAQTVTAQAPSDAAGAISPPSGVTLCRGQGDRSKLILYGIDASRLGSAESADAIFNFIQENAAAFLKP
jgi:hypothetical protein